MSIDHSKFMTDLPADDLDKLRTISDSWADGVKTNLMEQIRRGHDELRRIQTAQQSTRTQIEAVKAQHQSLKSERDSKAQKLEKEWLAKQAEVEELRGHIDSLKAQMVNSVEQSRSLDPQIDSLEKELLQKQNDVKMQKGVNTVLQSKYQSLLGLRIEAMEEEDELQFFMNNIDASDYDREVSFVLTLHDDYCVKNCNPKVPKEEVDGIISELKSSHEFGSFLKQMRSLLKSRI
ncbi:unnamed protein product [Kuraishia capsulata CBS 1993]|uniref:Kinetochore protein SPC25 n=1 Tax=Kuraishia capsulata CBS 1993 TaxID=1382522 RepID=W6MSY2_9ASCO|nr:uncharacterized protein KUCA_T00005925001 [Kuraishia capsulata CBS 1993]CDK29931.1 unnamed protein product [Kuraishia capsulata CBS 1993]